MPGLRNISRAMAKSDTILAPFFACMARAATAADLRSSRAR
jgi:hypothetical protein